MNCRWRRSVFVSAVPQKRSCRAALLLWLTILIAILSTTNQVAWAQSISSDHPNEFLQAAPSDRLDESKDPRLPSALRPLKPQTLEVPYHPMTSRQSLSWFITNSIGPSHLAGGIFLAGLGTALDRPKEYGPHWDGLADRYGMRKTSIVTGNAIEASASLMFREDPRYFRVPNRAFKARVGNAVRLTFAARGHNGSVGPAYARYVAIFGSSFLSNTWRVPSEANTQDALLRASEGFAGRLAANAFAEFWPDIKRHVFRKGE
jgi:hypothetical protein